MRIGKQIVFHQSAIRNPQSAFGAPPAVLSASAIARPAQGPARVRVGAPPAVNFHLPVDDDVPDAFRVLVRLLERRAVAHAGWVEDSDVGERARPQDASVAPSDARG